MITANSAANRANTAPDGSRASAAPSWLTAATNTRSKNSSNQVACRSSRGSPVVRRRRRLETKCPAGAQIAEPSRAHRARLSAEWRASAATVATVSSRTSERRQVTGCSSGTGAAADLVDREVSVGPVRDDVLAGREVLHDAIDNDLDLVRLERDEARHRSDLGPRHPGRTRLRCARRRCRNSCTPPCRGRSSGSLHGGECGFVHVGPRHVPARREPRLKQHQRPARLGYVPLAVRGRSGAG